MKATKSELIDLKQKLSFAREGKSLLERKLGVLVNEIMGLLKHLESARKAFNQVYESANRDIGLTIAYDGVASLKSVGAASDLSVNVDIKMRKVMGVAVPQVTYKFGKKAKVVSPFTTSFRVYKVKESYERVVQTALDLVGVEMSIKRLLNEVEVTKRRVNALGCKVIPELEGAVKHIHFYLTEKEREAFVRLKLFRHNGTVMTGLNSSQHC